MPDDEENPSAGTASSDQATLLRDLNRYDNPEVFASTSLPQYYRFQIPSFPERPVLTIEVNGDRLPDVLRERFFNIARLDPTELQDSSGGYSSWEEFRAAMLTDEAFLELERAMLLFFVRHLPQLATDLYKMLETMSVLGAPAQLYDDGGKVEILKPVLKGFLRVLEHDMKQMLGTRRRGGSRSKFAAETRQSLHTWYDEVHRSAKVIKKEYDKMFAEFENKHRRKGYTHNEWEEFWVAHARQRYGSEKEFVQLFATPGSPSASEVSYTWMAHKTTYTTKYLKRLVLNSRARTRKKVTTKKTD